MSDEDKLIYEVVRQSQILDYLLTDIANRSDE